MGRSRKATMPPEKSIMAKASTSRRLFRAKSTIRRIIIGLNLVYPESLAFGRHSNGFVGSISICPAEVVTNQLIGGQLNKAGSSKTGQSFGYGIGNRAGNRLIGLRNRENDGIIASSIESHVEPGIDLGGTEPDGGPANQYRHRRRD